MNPEFDNLLRLLESTDAANVRLGLQLARNYEAEVETHFGNSRQDLEALFDFLMQYEAWDFKVAFWEVDSLELTLNDNGFPIKTFPTKQLQHLWYFSVGYNQLQDLPTEIFQLQHLGVLVACDNKIQRIPIEITNLKELWRLELGNNQLQTLPAEIGQLQNLVYLNVEDNQLQNLPAEIGQLQNLQGLDLCNNPLKSLPEELCTINHYVKIKVAGTPKDMYIPESLKQSGLLHYE